MRGSHGADSVDLKLLTQALDEYWRLVEENRAGKTPAQRRAYIKYLKKYNSLRAFIENEHPGG